MIDLKHITKLNDIALVNISKKGQSIHEGRVTMISHRGINVITEYGVEFVKWCNVKKIKEL